MPKDARPSSATCSASCQAAQAPIARPHLAARPKPAAVTPARPVAVPAVQPVVHLVAATQAPRPAPTPVDTPSPAQVVPSLPVKLPVKLPVTLPVIPTPTLPVVLPTLPAPTPTPTLWNPYSPWLTNAQMIALIMSSMHYGTRP